MNKKNGNGFNLLQSLGNIPFAKAAIIVALVGGICLMTSGCAAGDARKPGVASSVGGDADATAQMNEVDGEVEANDTDDQRSSEQTVNPSNAADNTAGSTTELEDDGEYGEPLTISQLMQDLSITDLEKTMLYDDISEIGVYVQEWMKQNGYGSVRESGLEELDDGQFSPDIYGAYHIGGYDENGNYIGYLEDVGDNGSGYVNVYVSGSSGKIVIRFAVGSGPYETLDRQDNSYYKYESNELPTAEELGQIAMEWSISTEQ